MSQQPEPSPEEMKAHLQAAVHARRELGPEMEDHVLEAFLARIQRRSEGLSAPPVAQSGSKPVSKGRDESVDIGAVVGPFALAIPLVAIAGGIAGALGVFFVMCAVAVVEIFYFIDRWVRFNLK
jgi:hypothetical protein